MKIGWATPLNHASAIGQFSIGVTDALARRGVEIDLLRTEHASVLAEPQLASELTVLSLADMTDYHWLRRYDLLVYNIGDQGKFHLYAADAALQIPGICIFHDLLIFHLFCGWMTARGETNRIAAAVDELYGSGTYPPAGLGPAYLTEAAKHFAMLEWLAPHAVAAVAHGRHYVPRLASSCAGPVRHIPLPYDLPEPIAPLRTRQASETLHLATIGCINENKLSTEIISALGELPRLRERCSYTLAGPISDDMRRHLGDLANSLGVSLRMTGPLSSSELARAIESADALLCLRRPILEGASASAIEAMLSGRPTIVLDHGFYRDLPDEGTLKIDPDFNMRDLQRALLWIFDHPAECRELGKRAATWAQPVFSYDSYAEAFLELADTAQEARPLFRLGAQLGQELLALGAGPDDPATIRIAETATNLFCPGGHLCRQI